MLINLAELLFMRYFEKICGFDTTGYRKPDGRSLVWVMGAMGVTRDHVLFIGDSEVDMETARSADVTFVLVKTGLEHTISGPTPQLIVNRLDDLLNHG
jgi:phosphoglycolate phosphatase